MHTPEVSIMTLYNQKRYPLLPAHFTVEGDRLLRLLGAPPCQKSMVAPFGPQELSTLLQGLRIILLLIGTSLATPFSLLLLEPPLLWLFLKPGTPYPTPRTSLQPNQFPAQSSLPLESLP